MPRTQPVLLLALGASLLVFFALLAGIAGFLFGGWGEQRAQTPLQPAQPAAEPIHMPTPPEPIPAPPVAGEAAPSAPYPARLIEEPSPPEPSAPPVPVVDRIANEAPAEPSPPRTETRPRGRVSPTEVPGAAPADPRGARAHDNDPSRGGFGL